MKLSKKTRTAFIVSVALLWGGMLTSCKGTVSASMEPLIDDNDETENTVNSAGSNTENTTGNNVTETNNTEYGIDFADQPNGTLIIRNNTKKDMVLFEGENPTSNTILGGVHANASRNFDVSNKNDFSVGGWMLVKGMALSEYIAHQDNLANAKVEYSTMVTYRDGEKYEAVINSTYMGEYCIKVSNTGKIGIELHKDSFNGEKIAYLSPYKQNHFIYFDNGSDRITIFPVYVYYSAQKHTVSTLNGTFFETVTAIPAPITADYTETFSFPEDETLTWNQIAESMQFPSAYITITNSVQNQAASFMHGTAELRAQNGQNAVGGKPLTFEIEATDNGQELQMYMSYYGGKIKVPVKDKDNLDTTPVIKNGYDYNITVIFIGTKKDDVASYKATIDTASAKKRDIMSEIQTLPGENQ